VESPFQLPLSETLPKAVPENFEEIIPKNFPNYRFNGTTLKRMIDVAVNMGKGRMPMDWNMPLPII